MRQKWGWFLIFCLLAALLSGAALGEESAELIPNGSFENVDSSGNPVGWYATAYRQQEGYSRILATNEKAHTGQYSAMVENASPNDARLICVVTVEPESLYRFSGYVLVEDMEEGGNGANLALENVFAFSETFFDTQGQWKYVEWYGETGPDQRKVGIGVRVGGYGAESTGKAFFDDVSIQRLDELPQGITASLWYKVETAAPAAPAPQNDAPEKSTLLFVALALLFLLMALFCQKAFASADEGELSPAKKSAFLWKAAFVFMLGVALGARIVLSRYVAGYQVDINCFTLWSKRMADVGPLRFYAEEYFCDYPPGYMLMLWPIGFLLNAPGMKELANQLLAVKLIPILCDMGIAVFLFCFAKKRMSVKIGFFLSLLFMINPAALVNGAAWGQVDSLLALLMLLTGYFAMERKWRFALPLYVVGALMKPQALLLAPVGLVWLVVSLAREPKKSKQLLDVLWGLLAAAVLAVVIVFPFAASQKDPLGWLVALYSDTLSSYGYATLNTANLYYLQGANWKPLEQSLPIAYPLVTGVFLLGFGLWQTKRQGWLFAKEPRRRMRAEWRQEKAVSLKTQKSLLALLCMAAALSFFVLAILGCTYQNYGIVMMAFVYAWALTGALQNADGKRLPFDMALALIGIYVLGIKIHERYLFAALPLLLMGYVTTKDRRLLGLCVGFSATTFVNTAIILDNSILFGSSMGHLNPDTLALNNILCVLNLLLCGYAGYVSFTGLRESLPQTGAMRDKAEEERFGSAASYHRALLNPADVRLRLTGRDWLIMGVTTIVYACLAFANLGSTVAPQNGWVSTAAEEEIVFALDQDAPYHLLYYAGVSYNSFSVSTSDDGSEWSEEIPCEMRIGLCYRWKYAIQLKDGMDITMEDPFLDDAPENRVILEGKYLKLNAKAAGLNLYEILARNEQGECIPMRVVSHTGAKQSVLGEPKEPANLLDEQDTLQGEPGWFNSMYFDEIYHGRTAYEHLHGQAPYETTHPPLGKLIMAVGVAIFGMTPFGWRFAGTLIGVLMLPALYLFAKQLFKRRDLATFSMLLFAFDLMHFTQTRIATIDSFPVFFILLSYLCMARYMMTDLLALADNETPKFFSRAFVKSLGSLALCGLFMGLGIASKWIGLYSAVGLAALLLIAFYRQLRISNVACGYLADESNTEQSFVEKRRILSAQQFTLARILLTCAFCVVFFVAVPAVIYYLSYIPYLSPTGPVSLERVIAAQESMLSYHATPGLGMDHPFQSPWWQWPLILKPMWFVRDSFEPAGFASTIMCMGNPLIFYVGAACMAAVFAAYVCKYLSVRGGLHLKATDGNLILPVLVIGFLAQYLPWVLVPRSMYMYHYFASVPFIILATAWAVSHLSPRNKKWSRGVMIGYVVLAALFFILFYPYASGILTPTWWLDAMKWFPKLYY